MKTLLLTTLCACLVIASPSYAKKRSHYDNRHIDYARVVNVEPIYETISYKEPHRECYYEKRRVQRKDSHTAVIVGSLIGGAIGNELGHNKSNKKVGAVAGALLGGSIAHDIHRNKHGHRTVKERVCTTSYDVSYKEHITGYSVKYKYHGHIYSTTMDEHPGKRIRVAVKVRPLID